MLGRAGGIARALHVEDALDKRVGDDAFDVRLCVGDIGTFRVADGKVCTGADSLRGGDAGADCVGDNISLSVSCCVDDNGGKSGKETTSSRFKDEEHRLVVDATWSEHSYLYSYNGCCFPQPFIRHT